MSEPAPKSYDQSPFANPHILRRPDLDDSILKDVEITRLGDIRLVTAGWGMHETADEFIGRYRQAGVELKDTDLEMIKQSGFTGRYSSPPDEDGYSEEHQELQAQIGASLAKKVMKERGWDGADVLTLGSISSRIDTAQRAAEILKQDGITIDKPLFYGLACAGASAPLGDLNRMKSLEGARVIVIGLENLSGRQFPQTDIQTSWTFGNGGVALALIAGKEITHHAGHTWVEKDEGMITISYPPIYKLPDNISPQTDWPDWYEFVDKESRKVFAFYPGGVVMEMSTKDGQDVLKMEGGKTFKFFARRVPAHLLKFFQENQFSEFDLGPVIIHHPSKPVMGGIVKFYENEREQLAESGIIVPKLDIRWMMGKTGVNNVSAATILFAMQQMIKEDLIKPGVLTPLIGLGIGSVIHVDVIEFSKS